MLKYQGYPRWDDGRGEPQALPMTRPAALLLMLAAHGDWLAREVLAAQLWPDAPTSEAQHRLRLTLSRSRELLQRWDRADCLQAERSRLRLDLPHDLAQAATSDAFLAGYRLSGPSVQGFDDWVVQMRARRTSAPTPAGTPAPARALPSPKPLAGRLAELETLRRHLAAGVTVVLVHGEPGMGKSTLLQHALPGMPCLRGREVLRELSYRPLVELLHQHRAAVNTALREPASPLAAYRLDLARLMPEWAPGEPLPPLDALTAQSRLAEALCLALETLGPWLLVDDLPWCDDATWRVLLMLAQRGRSAWAASVRQGELPAPWRDALAALGSVQELHLGGLDGPQLRAAWSAQLPDTRDAPIEHWHTLARYCGGNPFLAGECLRQPGWDAVLGPQSPPASVQLQQRLARLDPPTRALVAASAVLGEPAPAPTLAQMTEQPPSLAQDALARAQAAGLLRADASGHLACAHDLLRDHLLAALSESERRRLHGAAAQAWARQPEPDPLRVAHHIRLGPHPEQAWPWVHRAARQHRELGDHETAQSLWHALRRDAQDPELLLLAQLELAAIDFFDDLPGSRAALEAVLVQLPGLAPGPGRDRLEARARSALVDNGVFSGDLPLARQHAHVLSTLRHRLNPEDQLQPLEVLIELAMREPDEAACWQLLGEMRQLAPQHPQVLSFEGQIHWFTGDIRAALQALLNLRERFPAHRRGLTIDNDIAVMCQALGRLDEAEAAAQASLQHWAGVAHTETLSRLVLGLVHTSAGRPELAREQLSTAREQARQQGSMSFEAEAALRLARLHLQEGDPDAANAVLAPMRAWLAGSSEPLRASQWAWLEARLALAQGQAPTPDTLARLAAQAARSRQPLVQLRQLQVLAACALHQGEPALATAWALQMQQLAERSGVLDAQAEACWLLAHATSEPATAERWRDQALAVVQAAGLHGLRQGWERARAVSTR